MIAGPISWYLAKGTSLKILGFLIGLEIRRVLAALIGLFYILQQYLYKLKSCNRWWMLTDNLNASKVECQCSIQQCEKDWVVCLNRWHSHHAKIIFDSVIRWAFFGSFGLWCFIDEIKIGSCSVDKKLVRSLNDYVMSSRIYISPLTSNITRVNSKVTSLDPDV